MLRRGDSNFYMWLAGNCSQDCRLRVSAPASLCLPTGHVLYTLYETRQHLLASGASVFLLLSVFIIERPGQSRIELLRGPLARTDHTTGQALQVPIREPSHLSQPPVGV